MHWVASYCPESAWRLEKGLLLCRLRALISPGSKWFGRTASCCAAWYSQFPPSVPPTPAQAHLLPSLKGPSRLRVLWASVVAHSCRWTGNWIYAFEHWQGQCWNSCSLGCFKGSSCPVARFQAGCCRYYWLREGRGPEHQDLTAKSLHLGRKPWWKKG